MTRSLFRGKFGLAVLIVAVTNGCVGHFREQADSKLQVSNLKSETGQATEPAVNVPAIIVHIDPKTGQVITPPSWALPGQIPQPPGDTAKQPLPELQQTLSPVPGGGVIIHLDERFMTPLTAIVDPDGKLRLDPQSTVGGSDDKK
jgi:hypothetical protein